MTRSLVMGDSWLSYLKNGLSRQLPDRIAGNEGYAGTTANPKNLRPFVHRHWRKGGVGAGLIVFWSRSEMMAHSGRWIN